MDLKLYSNVASKVIQNRLGINHYPSFLTFFITWACNHRCVFCDVWKKTPKDELTLTEIEMFFRQLKPLDVLRISGGEPFVRKDVGEIINIGDEILNPSIIHLTTNGINTNRIISSLNKVTNLPKVHIKVSIDNVGEKHDAVRGVKGAYDKAIETLKELVVLRDKFGLHVGVNQAILDEKSMSAHEELKKALVDLKVPVYGAIAYDSSSTLYSEDPQRKERIDPNSSLTPFGDWSQEALSHAINTLRTDDTKTSDFAERLIDNYFVNGLHDRMVGDQKNISGPSCVALNTHLRLLPNGDIPICLYNGEVVGNIRERSFKDIWFGEDIQPSRKWVKDCSGCWASCETAVNAVYTGDIYKGLLPKAKV